MAAGVATLRAYRDERLFERAREIEGWLRTRFDAHQRHRVVGEARGVGAFFGLELVADRRSAPLVPWQGTARWRILQRSARSRSLRVGRYNVAIVAPPLVVTDRKNLTSRSKRWEASVRSDAAQAREPAKDCAQTLPATKAATGTDDSGAHG